MSAGSGIGASARAIRHHYDVGNDFYDVWLDAEKVYSGAMWAEGDTLEAAQLRKLDWHAAQANAIGKKRVLDVGCGWGAMLRRLTSVHGVEHAVGLTLSDQQFTFIGEQPDPRVEVRKESWTEHQPAAPYEAIVSIGAFEHFARHGDPESERIAGYRRYFERCWEWLVPGGGMTLQTCGSGNTRREETSDFVANEIFPESEFPELSEIVRAADRLFEIVLVRNDRLDYARTLREWRRRLLAGRERAIAASDEETYKRYEKYFNLFIVSFEVLGSTVLYRITFRRIDRPRR